MFPYLKGLQLKWATHTRTATNCCLCPWHCLV